MSCGGSISAPLRRREVGQAQVGGAALEPVLRVAVALGGECRALLFHLDLHHQEGAARRGRRERFRHGHHLAGIFGIAAGERALGGGQQAVRDAHQPGLGQGVGGIHFERAAEQLHGIPARRTGELAALQGGLRLGEQLIAAAARA